MYALCAGLPGSIRRNITRRSWAHVSIALPQNSEPLSVPTMALRCLTLSLDPATLATPFLVAGTLDAPKAGGAVVRDGTSPTVQEFGPNGDLIATGVASGHLLLDSLRYRNES